MDPRGSRDRVKWRHGGLLFGVDGKEQEAMTLFLRPQGLEYSAESTSLSGSELVAGFECAAFVPLSATPPLLLSQPGSGTSGPISTDAGL